jgi:mevalonate kinase
MLVNQGLLWSMGASSKQCDELIYKLLDLGALGAKITGAGRGGAVIGLASKGMAKFIINELIKSGYEAFIAEPEYNGVRHINHDQLLPL